MTSHNTRSAEQSDAPSTADAAIVRTMAHACALADRRILREEIVDILHVLASQFPHSSGEAIALAGLLLQAPMDGHTCLSSEALAGRWTNEGNKSRHDTPFPTLSADAITDRLRQSAPLCEAWDAASGAYPPNAPLVYAFDRFYLHRTAVTEHRIACALRERLRHATPAPDAINALIAPLRDKMNPEQFRVIEKALSGNFTLVTGGPGTGKTWTVRALLAVEIARAIRDNTPLPRIALAAPTGKAAARVMESIRNGLDAFIDETGDALVGHQKNDLERMRNAVESLEAQTLHRVLGLSSHSSTGHDVHADILVVDEVSMVDAPMMRRVLEATDEHCRLVLIGDPNQLASVEAGSVLADFVACCEHLPAMADAYVHLAQSHRFTEASIVGRLAAATLRQDIDDLAWRDVTSSRSTGELTSRGVEEMAKGYLPLVEAAHTAPDPHTHHPLDAPAQAAFRALGRTQILCVHRTGQHAVHALNEAVTHQLVRMRALTFTDNAGLAVGMPIMVLANDYHLQRFNGDIGVVTSPHTISFPNTDGTVQHIPISQMPAYRPAFAITVHKSQGSEWDHVHLVLPPTTTRLLSRELLYTALSRAKSSVSIVGNPQILAYAIQRQATRATGLIHILSSYMSEP